VIFELLDNRDYSLLKEFLYMAIFIPAGELPVPKSILDQPEILRYIENFGKMPGDLAIATKDEDKIVGIIWGRKFQSPNCGYGYVDDETPEISMSVLSDYRGQGIGARLLEKIASKYFEMGIQSLSLSVDKRNPAIHLYKRAGYKIFTESESSYVMKKHLRFESQ